MKDHMSYESNSSFFIINFEGWGWCVVTSDRECRYFSACFHFTVIGNVNSSPHIIFWNFQPKLLIAQQCEHSLWNQWADNPVLIRELYKGVFTPTPSHCFHLELGTLLQLNPEGQEPASTYQSWFKPDLLPLINCLSDIIQADNAPINEPPSLLACISHQGFPMKKIPVWQVACIESSESNSQGTFRSRSQSQQHSKSPKPHHDCHFIKPSESFKLALLDAIARFTWKEGPEKLALLTKSDWSSNLVYQHTFLCIPDWKSQVQMYYYASCCPGVSNIHQVIDIAVVHQLEFALAICVSEVNLFMPVMVSGLDRMGIMALYQPGFTKPSFSYTKGTPAMFANTYLVKTNDILCCPRAQAFIGMGRPYSWIAERFGGPSIVQAFLSGPSIQVTRHLLRKSDSHEEKPTELQWDQVSAQEGSFLFGFVPSHDSTSPEHYCNRCSVRWRNCVGFSPNDRWAGELVDTDITLVCDQELSLI